jgi:hypothetical protein
LQAIGRRSGRLEDRSTPGILLSLPGRDPVLACRVPIAAEYADWLLIESIFVSRFRLPWLSLEQLPGRLSGRLGLATAAA